MYVLNITYENDKSTFDACTDNEENFAILLPTLPLTFPCGLSFLCLMSLMIYTFMKPLITNK